METHSENCGEEPRVNLTGRVAVAGSVRSVKERHAS